MSIDHSDAPGWPSPGTRVYQDSDPWMEALRRSQDIALERRRAEVRRLARQRWREANREHQREYARAWRAANPEKQVEYNRRRPRKTQRRVKR